MKNKWIALLLMAVMLFALTACSNQNDSGNSSSTVETNDAAGTESSAETVEEIAPETVVGKVNGVEVKMGDIQALYDSTVNQVAMMYSQYGYSIDMNDASFVSQMRTDVVNTAVEQLAMEQKLEEMGMGLTEEDIQSFSEKAAEDYKVMVESYVTSEGATEEEAKAFVESYGYTQEALTYFRRVEEVSNRLHTVTDPTVEVTDEEIQAKYEELVETDKTNFTSSADNFSNAVLGGSTVYYYPEGFRTIKILTIYMKDEIADQIATLQDEMYTCSYYISAYESTITDDMDATTKVTYQTMADWYQEQYDEKSAEVDKLMEEGLAQIQAEAEAALERAKAEGADFDALVAEFSAEEGIGSLESGYPISSQCTLYDADIMQAAMALENAGDISELIGNAGGYHIIMYTGELPETTVELSQVEETVRAQVLEEKQSEAYEAKKAELLAACEIETFLGDL